MVSRDLVLPVAGAVVLLLWLVGVAGRLGTSPTENWILFVAGAALVALAPVLSRRD